MNASEIIPFFSFREGPLGGHDHLISIEYLDDPLGMREIELREKIIEKEDDRKREVLAEEEYLDLFEREEEHLGLPSREHHGSIVTTSDPKSEVIEVRTDVSMPGEDISFPIFLEILCYIRLDIFRGGELRVIGELYLITREKCPKGLRCHADKVSEFFPIYRVEICLLGKAPIPKVEIFALCFVVSDFFEERISLAHHSFVVTPHSGKLSKSTSEDRVHIVTPHCWGKVEEVHIERREKYRAKWQFFTILHATHFPSLDTVYVFPIISVETILFRSYMRSVTHLEVCLVSTWGMKVVESSSGSQVKPFEDMRLSRTVGTDDTSQT